MATSTALRFRNRDLLNSLNAYDSAGRVEGVILTRILQDLNSISVNDSSVVLYRRLSPGDRITSITDTDEGLNSRTNLGLDSLSVSDSITVIKSQLKSTFDSTFVTDAGFITDKDYVRNRLTQDSITVEDGFQKTITRPDFSIVNKVIFESIEVIDNTFVTASGIFIRTLSDSISVVDFDSIEVLKEQIESLSVTDNEIPLRLVYRLTQDNITLYEDIIVGRSAIINTVTLQDLDSVSVIDRKTADTVLYKRVSAKIKHGIELY
jgi:hypothetical protein